MACYLETKKGLQIDILAQPKSSSQGWGKLVGERMQLKINTPPIAGRANAACIKWLSKAFKCPKRDIKLLRGEKSREKTFLLTFYDQGRFQTWIQKNL